jgi:hypothetical protein
MIGKLGRTYRLDIFTPAGKQITIEPPFSIHFNITRNTLASANKAGITLYNLGAATRNQIFKDRFSISEYWRVRLWAGYGGRLHEIFTGNIYEAMSYKEGTEWITTIDAFDGMDAIQNGFTATTVEAETDNRDVISRIINDMPNVLAGVLGTPAQGSSPRGQSLIGQSSELLSEQTGGQYFIDKEIVNILSDNEVLPGAVVLLDPSILLSTPRRREAFLDVPLLFEGAVQVGQVFEIQSLEPRYNGQYKTMGFTHDVMISEAQSGAARTDLQLYFGADGLQEAG